LSGKTARALRRAAKAFDAPIGALKRTWLRASHKQRGHSRLNELSRKASVYKAPPRKLDAYDD